MIIVTLGIFKKSSQLILEEINTEYSLDAEAKAPVLWPSDGKSCRLIGIDSDAGKDGGQEKKGAAVDKMVR